MRSWFATWSPPSPDGDVGGWVCIGIVLCRSACVSLMRLAFAHRLVGVTARKGKCSKKMLPSMERCEHCAGGSRKWQAWTVELQSSAGTRIRLTIQKCSHVTLKTYGIPAALLAKAKDRS